MAEHNKTTEDNTIANDPNSKIDAIKQLIFGDNMVEYNHEFEAVKKDILKKKKELENLMDDVKAELLQNVDNLGTDINIRITELENKIENKVDSFDDKLLDRKLFGDLLIKLGEKISN